eukprot:1159381-Pelagomonas_calceolata.AAC.3
MSTRACCWSWAVQLDAKAAHGCVQAPNSSTRKSMLSSASPRHSQANMYGSFSVLTMGKATE